MARFIITTDSTCDLPESYLKEHDIDVHPLYYRFGEDVYGDDKQLTHKEFYDRMRAGEMPTTMATNPTRSYEIFENRIKNGEKDILHIAFSSGLSSSCQNAVIAANEVKEAYPDANIIVIDSLSASLGEGLVVYKAVQMMEEDESIEEVADYVRNLLLHVAHHFTVDDLFHLYRGGRVSKATAIVGTIAGIKPNLHVDDEGYLKPLSKVRGRKKALTALVDTMEKTMGSYKDQNDVVMIGHDDTCEDAQFVADLIKERFGINNIVMNTICPTIGAHTGTGIIALFFLAEARK